MAIMPTAGTSIISGHTESVEVPQSNLFTRSTLSGRFQVVNRHLVQDLKSKGLWTKAIRNKIIENDGSVQTIEGIPQEVREIYKTNFEYKLTSLIKMCAEREAYICQSASNNRCLPHLDISILTNMHLYSWKYGLKTSTTAASSRSRLGQNMSTKRKKKNVFLAKHEDVQRLNPLLRLRNKYTQIDIKDVRRPR